MTLSKPTHNKINHSNALVSVVIRTQNRPDSLKAAIESVVKQDYNPIQLIIVNDAGKDISKLISAYQSSFYQLDHCRINTSKGRSHAANIGLEKCKGELIIFLDDDDWYLPNHIADLVYAYHQSGSNQVVYSGIASSVNDAENNPIQIFNDPFDPIRLLIENFIPIHAVLFSRLFIEQGCRFDETLSTYEDWDFWLQLSEKSSFYHIDQISAIYHLGDSSGLGQKSDITLKLADAKKQVLGKWQKRWTIEQVEVIISRSLEFPHLAVLKKERAELKTALTQTKKEEALQKSNNIKLISQKNCLETEITEIWAENLRLEKQLENILNSNSWKLTKPYRFLGRLSFRIKNYISFCRINGFLAGLKLIQNKLSASPNLNSKTPQVTIKISETFHPLHFKPVEKPVVSIIIPVFNNIKYTFHCLKSILLQSQSMNYEVIIVDDCSSDNTQEILKQVSGIQIINNKTNSGFIASCNHGAEKAKGKYVLFLNNDTQVTENWLNELLKSYHHFDDVGLVGAKLVYPDGRLQEAGGIVWQDGSAWNYGRLSEPDMPQYCYAREVDYCSGACILIEKSFFYSLGNFDKHYSPAYYEDTDLAFKVRQAGKKVIYQPNTRIIHFEGISSGTDTNSGVKQYQLLNHEKFFTRWKQTLQTHRANGIEPELEKERAITKRILVLDARMLLPDQDSGSLRMYNLLTILQKQHYKVTFCPINLEHRHEYSKEMQGKGIETIYSPFYSSVKDYLKANGRFFDLVIISRVVTANKVMDQVINYCQKAKIIYDTVDLHFLREQRAADCTSSEKQAKLELASQMKKTEISIMHQADATWVVSHYEKQLLNQEYPELPVHIVSNIHGLNFTAEFNNFSQRKDFMFIGGFEHKPNIDAVSYFCKNILPFVFLKLPNIQFHIVGSKPTPEILDLATEQIIVHGFVADIDPIFENIRLTIAPLRYGAGVKGKINTSMSYAVPVVATQIAAEGMFLEDGVDVLMAESDEDFADAIIKLHEDKKLWNKLSKNSLNNIEKYFSFKAAQHNIKESLNELEL